MKILIITVTFIVKTTIQSFHETLWLIIQYHQTKCGCKRISSSKDKIEIVISGSYKPLLCLDLKDGKAIFSHDTGSWICITIPCSVTEGSVVHMYILKCEPLLWPWPWIQQCNTSTKCTLQIIMICHQTKFGCKIIISSDVI